MESHLVTKALSEATFKLRPLGDTELRAIVRAMLTMSRSGVLVTGLDRAAIACNAEFGRLFRVDADSVPTLSSEELRSQIYPRLDDPNRWVADLEEIYADPLKTYEDEVELQRPHLWLRRLTGPLLDAQGELLGRLWKFEEITDEKARWQRRDAVQRLSMFHDPDPKVVCHEVVQAVAGVYKSPTIISIASGDTMIFREIALPPAGTEHVRGNLIEDTFCQLVLEENVPMIIQDGRKVPRVCHVLPVKLGYVRYLGVPLLDSAGAPIGTLCVLDTKAEELLDEEDVEFMSVMGNRVSVELERERLWDLRVHDREVAIERQSAELAATRSVLDLMNQGVRLVASIDTESELLDAQEALLQGALGFESVVLRTGAPSVAGSLARAWTLEGETFTLEFVGKGTFDEEFTRTHISALADQVNLTLAAFRFRRDLNAANTRLMQTEKLAAVGSLAATVAHDIRNIMASIAIEADSPDPTPEVLVRVRKQVERFSVLSHRLLSYVKPETMAKADCDLNETVRRAIEMLDPQIRAARVELRVSLKESLPHVQADAGQVEHMFVNLIVNALQASNRVGGVLEIHSERGVGQIRITVKDNGRGMEPGVIDRVFNPFFSTRKDGFGLGLYSCKRIADDHGWRLSVASQAGHGTEFSLTVLVKVKG
jgi:signal transduction histidine kinase